jgi:mono/diheme cytochrome c family protein
VDNFIRSSPFSSVLVAGVCLAVGGLVIRPGIAQDQPIKPDEAAAVDYSTQVKPLLRSRCYACHGALQQQGGLRLDTGRSILLGGDSGPAVAPRTVEESLLMDRVAAVDIADRMPPEHEGEALTAGQIALLLAWVAAGASSPPDEQPEADPRDHWAFRPLVRPPIPEVQRGQWVRNPIDAFVAGQHEQLGLRPQTEASRLVLLRRLSLDLIGLPPTADQIAAIQGDAPPDWYGQAVERLLDDPRHGERWARHWMDVWRYSDWWGLGDQLRNSQKHIWHWRDWIVESLNADMPYDEMVRLMLAADELHPNDLDKLRATGYLARNYWLFNRPKWMEETVEHVSKGFLGLTMNCARCHDHKYDPFVQADFYRLRAFFEPYHVRVDLVPGEADLARDGIPRAFDGLLEEPT